MVSQPVLVTADWEPPSAYSPRPSTVTQIRAEALLFRRLWIEAPDGRLLPDLATSVPGGAKLRVKLKPGLLWSDGVPLTAGDVASSVGSGVEVLSPTSLVIEGASARTLAGVFILPAHRPGVVSGPFRPAAGGPGRLVFERNPLYRGRPAYLAQVVELLLPSHEATVEAAQAGEVDLLPHLGPDDLGATYGGLRTVVTRSHREEMLVPRGLDPRVVSALSLATNRSVLIPGARPLGPGRNLLLASGLLNGTKSAVTLDVPCNDSVRAGEASALTAQWAGAGITATTTCGTGAAELELTGDQQPVPGGVITLALWPGVRAVSPRLHGYVPNDTAGSDYWNAADWWLS